LREGYAAELGRYFATGVVEARLAAYDHVGEDGSVNVFVIEPNLEHAGRSDAECDHAACAISRPATDAKPSLFWRRGMCAPAPSSTPGTAENRRQRLAGV